MNMELSTELSSSKQPRQQLKQGRLSKQTTQTLGVPSKSYKYGRMLTLQFKGRHCLSLGPNYICFGVAFCLLSVSGILVTKYVFESSEDFYFRVVTSLISGVQMLSYFLVATSDPGVILNQGKMQRIDEEQNGIQSTRICRRCGIVMIRNSYHCRQCDVCIRDYDHHCPWTSKCIGKGNLKYFYLFVSITPIFLVYSMVAFAICASFNAIQANQHLTKHI